MLVFSNFSASSATPETEEPMGNISILLADDSVTIQKVVGIIFAGDGFTLTVVDNGKAAVQKAQEIQPDVLLIDVLMPGMSGYEVCEAIRNDPSLASKPVLLLTGSFEPFDEAKAKQCGADAHMAKPFESQQLIAKVKELYEIGQGRSGAPSALVTESLREEEAPAAPPAFDAFVPPETPAVSPDDPWGAYNAPKPQQEPPLFEAPTEPDVMAMVSEEPPPVPAFVSDQHTNASVGASWVPVEEQTFEFEEQISTPPEEAIEPSEPFAPPVPEKDEAVQDDIPVPALSAAAPLVLTDEQLRQALMSASKETIERIVWEVVPDLAETLIKETIRRITEGK